jgi:hypothetical protein
MDVEAEDGSAAGRPLGFDACRWKTIPSEASKPVNEIPPLRPLLVELVPFRVDVRPGGLPRERWADDVPRLVFVYCRVLFLVFCLRDWVLAVSVISLGL